VKYICHQKSDDHRLFLGQRIAICRHPRPEREIHSKSHHQLQVVSFTGAFTEIAQAKTTGGIGAHGQIGQKVVDKMNLSHMAPVDDPPYSLELNPRDF
jgi:hypothetical protein